ncbi:MAG: hypothetical protein C5B51_05010 [Terriglobia bacterium]|nr:MAG: hypothetical protein C5B51_05010 [Terriglobia bacterium]
MASVLLLDDDLGFMVALSLELRKLSIDAIPARSALEAELLVDALQLELNVLVVNWECPGAQSIAQQLQGRMGTLPVISIQREGRRLPRSAGPVMARLCNPGDRRPERIAYCAEIIESAVYGVPAQSHSSIRGLAPRPAFAPCPKPVN